MSLLLDALKQAEKNNQQARSAGHGMPADTDTAAARAIGDNGLSLVSHGDRDESWTTVDLLPVFDLSPEPSAQHVAADHAIQAEDSANDKPSPALEEETDSASPLAAIPDKVSEMPLSVLQEPKAATSPSMQTETAVQGSEAQQRHLAESLFSTTQATGPKTHFVGIAVAGLLAVAAAAGYLYTLTLPDQAVYPPAIAAGESQDVTLAESAPAPAAETALVPQPSEPGQDLPAPIFDRSANQEAPFNPGEAGTEQGVNRLSPVQRYGKSATAQPADDMPSSESRQEAITVDTPEPIVIKVKRQPQQQAMILQMAYQRLQAGDWLGARQYYQQALHTSPDNIDALLGMATVAQRLSDRQAAAEYYRRVKALDQHNPYAATGLIALEQDAPASENELKELATQTPESAMAQAQLGHVYAARQQWSAAQQHYFQAMEKEPDNPDYVYNLAVSLDHLGKQETAERYYRQALALAQHRQAAFDIARTHGRLQQLTETHPHE